MLSAHTEGPVTRIRMARSVFGHPLHEVSAYLLGDLLIDTGPPATAAAFARWCRGRDIRQVVLTHHHEDHVGGAAALQRALGVPVAAPPATAELLARGLRLPLYRRAVWGRPRRLDAEPLGGLFVHGPWRFRVVPTPGHAFDHVCLFEEERRWLISGDLFVHARVKFLRRVEDLGEHLRSLRRALALEPELLICAHAGVVEDACEALERKIRYWEELAERAHRLASDGLSVRAVTRRLLGRESIFTYASFGDFSKANLIRALLRSRDAG